MGAKYISKSATGYNSSPPADDGSQTAANLVKWSTIKTKLADPGKTLADDINTALVSAFDYSVRSITSSDNTVAGDHMRMVEIASTVTTAVTVSLGDAATMTTAYRTYIKNSSAISQTVGRVTVGDTIDGVAANVTLAAGTGALFEVNAAGNGYTSIGLKVSSSSALASSTTTVNVSAATAPTAGQVLTATSSTAATWQAGQVQIQPISASVAASALTISASALSLDFRDATLTSGTVTTVSGTPANLVISSGSTLGTTSAVISRVVVLALNNAGTIELAVINSACGLNLDGTGVISTTAEGGAGGADSATVAYSTTARTNVAYRVIGYLVSTQATAGTWATAPSTIQGAGGIAVMLSTRTTQIFTSGSGTYTTPAGCKAISVVVQGGGAGAAGGGSTAGVGTAGNQSTFGSLTATGASAAASYSGASGAAGVGSGGDINLAGGRGTCGTPNVAAAANAVGGAGGTSVFGGAGSGVYGAAGTAAAANTGAGGGGGGKGVTGADTGGVGGSAGGYTKKLIVSPAASYSYAVGASAAGGAAGIDGFAGAAGAAGIIIVEEFY